jgi:hypothetical protein
MLELAYIQEYDATRMEPEQKDLCAEFEKRGIPVKRFTKKLLDRNKLALSKNTLVAGEVEVVKKSLRFLGIENPDRDCYPQSLRSFLKRTIRESTIKDISNRMCDGEFSNGIFVKPKLAAKKFTGFVLSSPDDLWRFREVSGSTAIYCTETVDWVAEFRVFVVNGQIVGVKQYVSDSAHLPESKIFEEAIQTLENSGEATAGYGIDFGILRNGETTLIEWNDGFHWVLMDWIKIYMLI